MKLGLDSSIESNDECDDVVDQNVNGNEVLEASKPFIPECNVDLLEVGVATESETELTSNQAKYEFHNWASFEAWMVDDQLVVQLSNTSCKRKRY